MGISRGAGWITTIVILCSFVTTGLSQDRPCNARQIEGRSVVCVCNADYCDTITRENPAPGKFVVYTSSSSGLRFAKSYGEIQTLAADEPDDDPGDVEEPIPEPDPDNPEDDASPQPPPPNEDDDVDDDEGLSTLWTNVTLRVYPNARHQTIEGFGGSVTDAAAINWRKLSDGAQQNFIDSYFGRLGIEYNMIRVPIAGCDFSEYPYTYAETPWHDHTLSNFSLSSHDFFLKLPMIKRAQRVATDEIKFTASTWSPPIWMKTNERITGFAQLRTEYYQAFADYHLRFIEEYDKAEVKIWAITTSNEPINGIVPLVQFNSIGWFPNQLARWVSNNLGPTIRNSRYNETKILGIDDQRYLLPVYLAGMELEDKTSLDYLDGIAVHWYGNFFPPQILTGIQRRYPDKILLATEACEGSMPWNSAKVVLGSWSRARRYVSNIIEDLNNYVVGWIDWNLCLDPIGGPNWVDNFVDSPILVYGDKDEFIKQPMFYAMGHFSKFIPRGSQRVRVSRRSLLSVENLVVRKRNGNLVMVLQNRRKREINVRMRISARNYIEVTMEPESVKTIEVNPN